MNLFNQHPAATPEQEPVVQLPCDLHAVKKNGWFTP